MKNFVVNANKNVFFPYNIAQHILNVFNLKQFDKYYRDTKHDSNKMSLNAHIIVN